MLEPDFRDMLVAFNRAGVEYIVVGAYALAAHGISRATRDFDLWVRGTPENADRVLSALAAFGAPRDVASKSDLLDPNIVIQIGVEPLRIDIMTDISGVAFDEAQAASLRVEADGVAMPVLGRAQLLANKRASGRKQDLLDIKSLEAQRR